MNVTPLVDVVLVLLIIFMVIVPQMAAGATVDLAAAQNYDPQESKTEPFTLSVTRAGNLYLEKARVDSERLLAKLESLRERDPYRRIRIKADKQAPYGFVRAAFKLCQKVGFPGVGLQVGDRKQGEEEG